MALTTATPVGLGAVAMFNVAFGIVISPVMLHLREAGKLPSPVTIDAISTCG